MSKGIKAFGVAILAFTAIVVIVGIAVVISRGVEKGTVIELTLSGPIEEERDTSLYGRLFQGDVTLTQDLTEMFRKARRDDKVAGVMAVIRSFDAGAATIEELRDAVHEFRGSGKWAVAYLDTAGEFYHGTSAYWLASAFEDLTLAPPGDVNLVGVIARVRFLRGTLDKLGVYPDVYHIGPYKSARNQYTEKGFTEAHREATEALVEDIYKGVVEGIARSRGRPEEEIAALIDRGPFTSEEALEEGLVDRLGYYDEFREAVRARAGGRLPTLEWDDYLDRRSGFAVGSKKIAVIHGTGTVMRGRSAYDPSAGFIMGSDTVAAAIREAREDSSIEGIILRINSPGGSALGSDLIWREADIARKDKPVVASFGDLAASGGYYVACSADRVVAEPSTLTGSIGVVYGKLVTGGLWEWLGVSFEEVQRGKNAHLWSELRRWTPEERVGFTDRFLASAYDRFVTRVATGREMTAEGVDAIGQGRVWTGRRALELGLIDEIGGFETAVRAVKKLAEIPEEEDVRFVFLPEKEPWWRVLFGGGQRVEGPPPIAVRVLEGIRPLAVMALLEGEPALLSPVALSMDLP